MVHAARAQQISYASAVVGGLLIYHGVKDGPLVRRIGRLEHLKRKRAVENEAVS